MTTDIITRQRDFILEGEDEEYAQTFTALMAEIAPDGILEQTFATEIMGASWRLRRCRILEFDLARSAEPDAEAAIQTSIDRARAQSHNILRRSMAELRKLQTERQTRFLMIPGGVGSPDLGLTDTRKAVKTAAQSLLAAEDKKTAIKAQGPRSAALNVGGTRPSSRNPSAETCASSLEASSFCKPAKSAPTTASSFCNPVPAGSSFCNPPAATPRNAQCPCGSGAKYKRCCGRNAPPVLNRAA
jgi:hypothetical protein